MKIIKSLGELSDKYQDFIFDQFGVLHSGLEAYPGVVQALKENKDRGKRNIILSNSTRTAEHNFASMEKNQKIPKDLFAGMVTSGDFFISRIREVYPDLKSMKSFVVARDDDYFNKYGIDISYTDKPAAADLILFMGMKDVQKPLSYYEGILAEAAAKKIPSVCANPDLQMISEGIVRPGVGSVAAIYEKLGGSVLYMGKPHVPIYEFLFKRFSIKPENAVALGDSPLHDLRGANNFGFDSVFVLTGIHEDQLTADDDAELMSKYEKFRVEYPDRPTYLMRKLK